MSEEKESPRECNCLSQCSHVVQHGLESIFSKLGGVVGRRPLITIAIAVLVAGLCGIGILNWSTESRTEKLWIPPDTEAEGHSEWVSDVFGYETRSQEILLRPSDNGNVLKADYVRQYYIAHMIMVNHSAPALEGFEDDYPEFYGDAMYSWNGYKGSISMCERRGDDCVQSSILDIIASSNYSVDTLTDDELLDALNTYDGEINLESIIGGLQLEDDYGAVFKGRYSISANAIIVNNNFEDPTRENWELEVNELIQDYKFQDVKVVPYFAAAFSQEFGSAIGADGAAFSIGCFLLIIYTTIALGKRDYVHSMCGLAVCAIITVALAVIASFGISAAFGIFYTPLGNTLPFLALGLGVDDAFIIAGEFQQQVKFALRAGKHDLTSADLMQKAMAHAGVSILITSVTDFVAFSIGSSTVLPALRAYCLFAAFGVLFVFSLNITFFAACVVLDHDRAMANRMDCCCCVKLETPHPMFPELVVGNQDSNDSKDDGKSNGETNRNERLPCCGCLHKIPSEASRKMFRWLGEQISNLYVRIAIIVCAVGLLAFGIFGATQLKQEFKIEWFIPDTSYLQDYYSWNAEFFSTGTPLFIYSRDIDYYEYQDELLDCNALLTDAPYVTGGVFDWHKSFVEYANDNSIQLTSENYYANLNVYLTTSGARFRESVRWIDDSDPSQGLEGAVMIGGYTEEAVIDAQSQVVAMDDVRDDMSDIVDVKEDNIFAFTFQMLFWEQYKVIAAEFYRNLVLAICVVFGIALILIPKISAALLVLLSVTCTIVDVLGFMYLWGLTIDAVTVCYTVIAIGLAVDYSAHVGEAFVLSNKSTKPDKVIDALDRVGASVFNGAFSTFLAVVAMANSQTYIFRVFFRQFFLVTLLGSLHGLVVLPALLTWLGPTSGVGQNDHDDDDDDDNDNKEKKEDENKQSIEMNEAAGQTNTMDADAQTTETEPVVQDA